MTLTEVKIEMDALNERTASDVELQRNLLSCFEGEFAGARNSLNAMVLEGDCNAVASGLHKLKGSVGISNLAGFPTNLICACENSFSKL